MMFWVWKLRANFYAWRHGLPWGLAEADGQHARAMFDDGTHPIDYAMESVWR